MKNILKYKIHIIIKKLFLLLQVNIYRTKNTGKKNIYIIFRIIINTELIKLVYVSRETLYQFKLYSNGKYNE